MYLEKRVIDNYSKLNETDLYIWEFIKNKASEVSQMTLDELSDELSVSRTTIFRFVKKIELSGYSEFKVHLSDKENKKSKKFEISDYYKISDSLINYIGILKGLDFNKEIKLISNAKRIFIYGTGDLQSSVAKELRRMFLSEKELAYVLSDKTYEDSLFELFNDEDILIIISLTGNNKQALEISKKAKIRGTKIISITEFKHNDLNLLSDESIYIYTPEINFLDSFNNYTFTSMFYVLVEMLFIQYSIFKNK